MARFLALLSIISYVAALAWSPTETLRITSNVISSDCTNRTSMVVNGTSPGPVLRFKEGDHIWIRVYNDMDSNTTLHFHGLSQLGSPFSDGTPQTSQWPIAPKNFFDYEFFLEPGSAGTYMYHTHVEFQIMTAYGAFIVEDGSPSPYKYKADITLLFGDFYHALSENVLKALLGTPFTWIGEPQSMTVNGDALSTCNSPSGCSNTCHHHVVEVEPDTVYRVRAIGISALTFQYMTIESHSELTFIEADGSYIKGVNSSRLQVHSGQRFSFLLKTKSEKQLKKLGGKRQFWGRVESRWRPVRDQGAFIMSYKSPHDENVVKLASMTPTPSDLNVTLPIAKEGEVWIDHQMAPLKRAYIGNKDETQAPKDKDVSRTITLSAHQLGSRNGRWFVDGLSYSEIDPSVPYLVQAYQNPSGLQPNYDLAAAHQGYDPSTGTYPIKMGETVDIIFLNNISDNGFAESHPWHLHGQHPFLIESGVITNDSKVVTSTYTPREPVRRDTVIAYAGQGASYAGVKSVNSTLSGYTKVRMTANTPGAWLVHCHIQPHAVLGMAVVFLVAPDQLPTLPEDLKNQFLTFNPQQNPKEAPKSFIKSPTSSPTTNTNTNTNTTTTTTKRLEVTFDTGSKR